ncbi:hypothetical protein NKR23_g12563 [Pleurostoma richardsiae]|uniref:Uncharacterized protein n=1 Tax=Pleurostoma richardsiae TaxID=41990 RepID=A0AA38R134_9PEZI|nr:hypothetical protein NKR23_g12563 [Pleurostoma richardsiae]
MSVVRAGDGSGGLVPGGQGLVSRVESTPGERYKVLHLLTGDAAVRTAMEEYCVNDLQRALWALPSVDVDVRIPVDQSIETWIAKVKTRQSYLNGILIQSRGRTGLVCDKCARNAHPFPACVRAAGHFGGACGCCEYQSGRASCSVRGLPDKDAEDRARTRGLGGAGGAAGGAEVVDLTGDSD